MQPGAHNSVRLKQRVLKKGDHEERRAQLVHRPIYGHTNPTDLLPDVAGQNKLLMVLINYSHRSVVC